MTLLFKILALLSAAFVVSCGKSTESPLGVKQNRSVLEATETENHGWRWCLDNPLLCWTEWVDETHVKYSKGSGWVYVPMGSRRGAFYDVGIQADGKIVAAGQAALNAPLAAISRLNNDGSLDSQFGMAGAAVEGSLGSDYFYGVGIQTDGKILGVGGTQFTSTMIMARFTSSGILDTTFDSDGLVRTGSDGFRRVGLQTDGRIFAVGNVDSTNSNALVVRQYLSNGSLDTSFHSDGQASAKVFGDGSTDTAYGFGLDLSGRITVIAQHNNTHNSFGLARFNLDGTLDTTFHTDGKVTTTHPNLSGGVYGRGLSIQTDGKILAIGDGQWGGLNSAVLIQRLLLDGTIDTSFGTNGSSTIPTTSGGTYYYGYGIGTKDDGTLVVGGYAYNGSSDYFVAFLNTVGTVTNSYTLDNGNSEQAYAMALQTNGQPVLAGNGDLLKAGGQFAIARFGTSAMDTSFHSSGWAIESFFRDSAEFNGVLVQTDGKIVAAGVLSGATVTVNGVTQSGALNTFAIARLNKNGTIDATFGTGGMRLDLRPTSGTSQLVDVALATDGRIYAVGDVTSGGSRNAILFRFNIDGTLDTAFNSAGYQDTYTSSVTTAKSVTLQPDGKPILVADRNGNFLFQRYETNGTFDTAFSLDGFVEYQISGTSRPNSAIVTLSGNQILAAGSYTVLNIHLGLMRVTSSGLLDTSFNSRGTLLQSFLSGWDDGKKILATPNNEYIVVGYSDANGNDFGVARFLSNGVLDTTFNRSGKLTISSGSGSDVAYGGALGYGKIVAVGAFSGNATFGVMRIMSDGALDTTFRTNGKLSVTLPRSGGHQLNAVQIASDGSLVVGGYYDKGVFPTKPVILRISP